MLTQIRKRNGNIVPFDSGKITIVMRKAFTAEGVAVEDEALAQMNDRVLVKLEARLSEGEVPTVEQVQDLVEDTLMERGHFRVAKHYILYRFEHAKERKEAVVKEIEQQRLMVEKRDGRREPFSREKARASLAYFIRGYEAEIDLEDIVRQIELEVYDTIRTDELARLITLILRARIERDPAYSAVAARQLCFRLYKEAMGKESLSAENFDARYRAAFAHNIRRGVAEKKLDEKMLSFNLDRLANALLPERDDFLRYLGVETLHDRYFIRDAEKKVLETPQYMWMRVAMGLALNESDKEARALEFYEVMSSLRFVPSTPTLFHAGTPHPQLSSCYLNTVEDDLNHIFKVFGDNAQLSKWAGGIGTDWTNIRGTGSLIKSAGITSQGVIPFLKIANDVTVAINRSGRRRGATCVYLENWHYDFEDFLELRKNTGDERRRTHDMDTASWISDLFMKRVRADGEWTLFSPEEVPGLHETYGKAFETLYHKYEDAAARGEIALFKKVKARDLWKKMLGMLFESGHPWITFKDPSNIRSPQDHAGVVHNSNLCCMAADQRVVTSEGLVTVGYLYEKARLLGLVSADGKATLMNGPTNTVFGRSGPVAAGPMLLPRPGAPMAHVVTREGYTHKVTPDHKVWVVDRGWVEAQELMHGDKIEIQQGEGLWGTTNAPHDAYVCGIVAGDGTFTVREGTTSVMIDVWANEFRLLEEIEEMVGASILADGEHIFNTSSLRRPRFVGNSYKKRLTSAPLARALAKRGFTRETKLKVPEFVWTGTRETVAAYLRGLYAADGTVQSSGGITTCSLASVSKTFLGEVQILLANFGIKSSLARMRADGPALMPDGHGGVSLYNKRELWRLMVTSIAGCRIMESITGLGELRGNTGYLANLKKKGYAQKMYATFERLEPLPSEDAYCLQVFTDEHSWTVNGVVTKNTEITLNTSAQETAVCNLGSVNFARHITDRTFDREKVQATVQTAMRMLDNVIDLNFYPTKEAKTSNVRHRPVGLGIMGFHDALYQLDIRFASPECVEFADSSMEIVSYYAILYSSELARERGAYESFRGSKWDRGILPVDTIRLLEEERGMSTGMTRTERLDWARVRDSIRQHGMRNSNTMAIAPTATIANISGAIPGIEPIYKNIYVKANISGDFVIINPYLVADLKARGLWSEEMLNMIKYNDGSIQDIPEIGIDLKEKYRETFEIDMRWIIRAAAARGKWIDQSQSLNIFFSGTSGEELSDLYLFAWESGLKTTYYLRSLAATQVEKSTIGAEGTHLRSKMGEEGAQKTAFGAIPSPIAVPSPMTKEAVEAGKVYSTGIEKPSYNPNSVGTAAVLTPVTTVEEIDAETAPSTFAPIAQIVEKKQYTLHVAEDAICEACQ